MRRIVGICGDRAQFALADDGTQWFWTGEAWTAMSRPALPQPVMESDYYKPGEVRAVSFDTPMAPHTPEPVKPAKKGARR